MSLLIRAAARTLPASMRDRYREQWLADVRDAPEAGIRPSSIALAALAFAVTYDRPSPLSLRTATPEVASRRARLAVALALSAALLSLSTYIEVTTGSSGLTQNSLFNYAEFVLTALLTLFAVIAPVAAIVLVSATAGVSARKRGAVWLLVVASLAPLARAAIDAPNQSVENIFATLGMGAYLLGGLLVIAAVVLLRPTVDRRWSLPAGLIVLAIVSACSVLAIVSWANHVPLVYALPDTPENEQWLAEWLYHKALGEQIAAVVLSSYVGVGLVLAAAAFVVGRRSATVAAIAICLIATGGVFGFLNLWVAETVPDKAATLMLFIGRVALIATVLIAVGGVRYLPRVRHRHDVESGVELL